MSEIFTYDEFKEAKLPKIEYIKTNCKCVDNMTNGLVENGIHLICGGSGNGKSLLLLHIALNIAKVKPVLYLSLENDIRIDKIRFDRALETYKLDNLAFTYINDLEDGKGLTKSAKKISGLLDYIEQCNDTVIVIDAPEYLIDAKDGMDSFQAGKGLLEKFKKYSKDYNQTYLISWQLARGVGKCKISDLRIDDISTSIAAARIASSVWAIHRNGDNWGMRLLKSRTEIFENIENVYNLFKDKVFDIRLNRDTKKLDTSDTSKLKDSLNKIRLRNI